MRRTSFSQNNLFSSCPRWWYYQYIKKVPVVSDMSYADRGTIVHKILQNYYDKKITTMAEAKKEFNTLWQKYNMDYAKWNKDRIDGLLSAEKKSESWLMIVNGIQKEIDVTSTELKVFFEDALAYFDNINTKLHTISDWKTSTRTVENEEEYKKQLFFYSYLYYRKFNVLPNELIVYYLKYNGSKGEYKIVPTTEDVEQIKQWHLDIQKRMDKIVKENKLPERAEECSHWCPYKNLCSEDGGINFTLKTIGNYIQIIGSVPPLLHKGIVNKFSYELKNAYWIKKNNPYAKTTIELFNVKKQLLPIGFKNELFKTFSHYEKYVKKNILINEIDTRMPLQPKKQYTSNIILREYQNEAVNTFLTNKIGLLEIGTGGGKTEIAISCIEKLGLKTLFIVDRVELLKQTKKRIEDNLNIEVGVIGSGEDNIKDITVATIQTLVKNIKKYSQYLSTVEFVIFDECHKVAAKSYWKIGLYLPNTHYRLGLSGTAFRDDGNDMMIHAVTGTKVYDLGSKKLIEDGWLTPPKIIFLKDILTEEQEKLLLEKKDRMLINPSMNYMLHYQTLILENEVRNNIISKIVGEYKDRKVLILVKLIEHGKLLGEMLGADYLYGSTGKKQRDEMFTNFVEGNTNILISTMSIFAEGIDIPILDVVINVSANAGTVKTIQSLGRALRKHKGKKEAMYIDFCDEYDKVFSKASWQRRAGLKQEGHNVQSISYKKFINQYI